MPDTQADSVKSKQVPEQRVVATPCRVESTPGLAGGGDGIPFADSSTASKPQPGKLRISQAAVDQRLRRIMTPSAKTGQCKVSSEIVKMYKDKKGKTKLSQLFQTCGYDPDTFLVQVELYREDMQSNELVIEGEYASEKTMRDDWHWTEFLGLLYSGFR